MRMTCVAAGPCGLRTRSHDRAGGTTPAPTPGAMRRPPRDETALGRRRTALQRLRGRRADARPPRRDQRARTRPTPGAVRFVVLDCLSDTLRWDLATASKGERARRLLPHGPALPARGRGDGAVRRERGWRRRGRTAPNAPSVLVRSGRQPRVLLWTRASRFPAVQRDNVLRPVRALRGFSVANTLWRDVRSARPSHVFVHPHAMTFDVDVPRGFGRDAEAPRTPETPETP